jgi:hypothetical protein
MESYRIFYKNGKIESDEISNIQKLDFDFCVNGFNTIDEIHFVYFFHGKKIIILLENLDDRIFNVKIFKVNENLFYEKVYDEVIQEICVQLLHNLINQTTFLKKIIYNIDYN